MLILIKRSTCTHTHPPSTPQGAQTYTRTHTPTLPPSLHPSIPPFLQTGDEHFKGYVDFPESQLSEWERCWGFIEETTGHACVLGEWGGKYDSYHNDKDMLWQDRFAKYLVEKCLSDQFVWDLNPESGDTGGVLKSNWWDEEEAKLALYDTVQPHPSWLFKEGDKFFLEPGQYANPKCDPKNKKQ